MQPDKFWHIGLLYTYTSSSSLNPENNANLRMVPISPLLLTIALVCFAGNSHLLCITCHDLCFQREAMSSNDFCY